MPNLTPDQLAVFTADERAAWEQYWNSPTQHSPSETRQQLWDRVSYNVQSWEERGGEPMCSNHRHRLHGKPCPDCFPELYEYLPAALATIATLRIENAAKDDENKVLRRAVEVLAQFCEASTVSCSYEYCPAYDSGCDRGKDTDCHKVLAAWAIARAKEGGESDASI